MVEEGQSPFGTIHVLHSSTGFYIQTIGSQLAEVVLFTYGHLWHPHLSGESP